MSYPIYTAYREPVFVGDRVHITLDDQRTFDLLREACQDDKTLISGVQEASGALVGTLLTTVRFYTSSGRLSMSADAQKRITLSSVKRGEGIFALDYAEAEDFPYGEEVDTPELRAAVDEINARLEELFEEEEFAKQYRSLKRMEVGQVHEWINRNGESFCREEEASLLFLETSATRRAQLMSKLLAQCLYARSYGVEFHDKVEKEMQDAQKEYYLREELKVINDELYGEANNFIDLEQMIEDCKAPTEVIDKLKAELAKLANMQPASPESFVARNWIETVSTLPWGEYSVDNMSVDNARAILEQDHYGLDKVKQRVLEFLAIHKLVGNKKGTIMCLYGPPGVGKTSIAKSIAKALGREYIRISLGGMHDEAEIRGHRRTYIGSMAGKIITNIKKAGKLNPVFLLDEVDKLSNDYKGDPASALLEVLDPEQNKAFVDNYVEVPFDLSNVLFITTANDISTIARPLLDRMELIELTGYTAEEKEQIALRYLLPKQIELNGMPKDLVTLTDGAIKLLIDGYTREAGVRQLEQNIGALCRKVAVSFGDNPMTPVTLDEGAVRAHLGLARYEHLRQERKDAVGMVTGLAWTELGGETMDIEAVLMPTKGGLKLTGNLGKVMRESALTAYSYLKSHAELYGLDLAVFDRELHIHATEGAVPKDGPSAGCALTVVMLSALSGRKVRCDRALTGEVSLTGRVLAIGGLKEKSLGALRDGISTILVPQTNRKDVDELPDAIKSKVNYIYVSSVDTVIKEMLL